MQTETRIDLLNGATGIYAGPALFCDGPGEQPAYLRPGDRIEIANRLFDPVTRTVAEVTVEVLGGSDRGDERWTNAAGEACISNRFGKFVPLRPEKLALSDIRRRGR